MLTRSPLAVAFVQGACRPRDRNGNPQKQPVVAVTIHATCPSSLVDAPPIATCRAGMARNTARYFATATTAGAHYTVDVAEIVQSFDEDEVTWHDGDNWGSVGIEICGQAVWSREQWLSDDVYPALVRAAALVRDIATRHGIPMVWRGDDVRAPGLRTHAQVSALIGMRGGHTDPGPGFPMDIFLALVTGEDA